MNRNQWRKRQVCQRFEAFHKEKIKVKYDDLLQGKHGDIEIVKKTPVEYRITVPKEKTIDGKVRFFYFEPVVKKKHGGQPVNDDDRRVSIPLRLPARIKNQLEKLDGTMTENIEQAVVDYLKTKGE
jgi:hypothetical protein